MKKKKLFYALFLLCLSANVFDVVAQDNQTPKTEKKGSRFGSFMKKVGEATTGINMTDEPFVVNPNAARFKVDIVDCIGNSAEQKFTLTLKITNKGTNESNMCIGGSCGGNTLAVDKQGNSYKSDRCAGDCKDFPTNVPVKVTLIFEKVLPSVQGLEVIKFNLGNYGNVELRNIKLSWDVPSAEPTSSNVAMSSSATALTNSLSSKYDIQLVSCDGDVASQRVAITLKFKNKATNERICVGGSCGGNTLAVDLDGNSYKSETCAGDCIDLPTGVFVKSVTNLEKVLPTVKAFDYVKISVGNSFIELRNLPVNWK